MQFGNQIYVLICVYMPYECSESEDIYLEKLGIIKAIIDDLECTCISLVGDWNSNISDSTSLFGNHVKSFCTENNLLLSSETYLPSDTFTHYSEAWHTTSWLDHCVSTRDTHDIITDITVWHSISTADHFPVCIDVSLQCIPEVEMTKKPTSKMHGLAWDKVSQDGKNEYCTLTDISMQNINIPYEAISCKDVNCINESH